LGAADGVQHEYPNLNKWYDAGIRATVGVPLVSGDDGTCVLFLASTALDAYDDDTMELVHRVGFQISGAIANSLLFTERVLAEEALAESESQFRGVFENSPIAIGLVSPDGRIIDVNQATCKLLGSQKKSSSGVARWNSCILRTRKRTRG
jgi:PAS domain-containing protein